MDLSVFVGKRLFRARCMAQGASLPAGSCDGEAGEELFAVVARLPFFIVPRGRVEFEKRV